MKSIGRSSGRSATAAAAYRTADQVIDERTGLVHDYQRKGGVEHVSMHGPKGMPNMTTAELWNLAEAAEKKKNSQVARELLVALPHELSPAERIALAEQIAQQLADRYGVAAQVAVHAPGTGGDQRNHHAHIMFTTRRMGADGQLGEKTRELDVKPSSSREVKWMRDMYEAETNAALAAAGRPERIDMRSLEDQEKAAPAELAEALAYGPPTPEQRYQIDRISALGRAPQQHEGPRVTAIRRECEQQQRPPLGLCDRMAANDELAELAAQRAELAELDAQIYHLERYAPMQAAAAQERLRIEQQQAEGRRLAELRAELPAARQALAEAQARAGELRAMPEPAAFEQAKEQREAVAQLAAEAKRQTAAAAEWRQAHPARAWVADRLGIEPAAERAAREARDTAQAARLDYDASDTKAEAVAWQKSRTELSELEKQLPELREQQRQIEDELLQHAGPDALRKATEQQLARAQRAEQHMQPHDLEHAQERRQELAARLHQGGTPADQVQLYRDAEQHGKDAQQLGEEGAQVRSLACLRMAREQLAAARQTLADATQRSRADAQMGDIGQQITDADAQAKTWQMDPRQRGSVDACEQLLEQAGELKERAQEAAQQLQEQRRQELTRQIDEKLAQRVERDPGPRSSGPRMG